MRLPVSAHTSRPWRIHEMTGDFRVEDVWALPTPGGPDDLAHLVRQIANGAGGDSAGPPLVYRALFAIRRKLGRRLGWDDPGAGLGTRVPTLRDRLPADLQEGARGPESRSLPFTSVYQLHDEWAAETANRTVHAVMHIGWVPAEDGGHRGQMAVLVKPNGRRGALYMAAIKPFRHLGVYPALLRTMGRTWRTTAGERTSG
ncbi:DUF2867 domain-containing protein [Streptomyces sp. 1222.5]|uniref:DUF2867 domain-containing protein n=1 Tax=Streptomyces sp. 1222.5 TaxID=1881026 RepID=UPI003EBA174D